MRESKEKIIDCRKMTKTNGASTIPSRFCSLFSQIYVMKKKVLHKALGSPTQSFNGILHPVGLKYPSIQYEQISSG